MVKDSGAQARVAASRTLNEPRPVKVSESGSGWPQAVVFRGALKVQSISDRWRIDDEWWRERPVSRMYFECQLEDGRELTVFRDLLTGKWSRQAG